MIFSINVLQISYSNAKTNPVSQAPKNAEPESHARSLEQLSVPIKHVLQANYFASSPSSVIKDCYSAQTKHVHYPLTSVHKQSLVPNSIVGAKTTLAELIVPP